MRPRGLKCRIILFRIKVGVVAGRQRPKQIARDLQGKRKQNELKMSIGFFFFLFVRYYKANSPSVEVNGDKETLSFVLTSLALDSQRVPEKETILTLFRLKPTYSSTHLKMYTNLKSEE
jgi:hypothetical protein